MREPDSLPETHPRFEPPDELEANSREEAVIVQQWHQNRAIALGDEEEGEWLIAPNAYGLDMMR